MRDYCQPGGSMTDLAHQVRDQRSAMALDEGMPGTAWTERAVALKSERRLQVLTAIVGKCSEPGHLMQRANSLEKTSMLGQAEGGRRRGSQKMRWSDGITDSTDMNLSKLQETVKESKAWRAAAHGIAKSWT